MSTDTGAPDVAAKATELGAMETIRRGLALSPELRVGLGVTGLLALGSTAGRVVVPVLVQQVLDRGFDVSTGTVDMGIVTNLVLFGALAVALTALSTGMMNLRLAVVAEQALSNLRRRAFAHIHDLSMLHQAGEQRGVLVARVTTDIDQISRFMQWAGLQLIINFGQATLALTVMLVLTWQLALVVVVLVPVIAVVIKLFQGRLAAERGLDELVRAWDRDPPENAVLFLRGPDSSYKDRLRHESRGLACYDRSLFFLPGVAEDELIAAAAPADVGIIPYAPSSMNTATPARISCRSTCMRG